MVLLIYRKKNRNQINSNSNNKKLNDNGFIYKSFDNCIHYIPNLTKPLLIDLNIFSIHKLEFIEFH